MVGLYIAVIIQGVTLSCKDNLNEYQATTWFYDF